MSKSEVVAGAGVGPAGDETSLYPPAQTGPKELSDEMRDIYMSKILRQAGLDRADERERKMFRYAMYMYFWMQGTSGEASYSDPILMANGKKIPGRIPLNVCGAHLRKLLRCYASEFVAMVYSKDFMQSEGYEKAAAPAKAEGVALSDAWLSADFIEGFSGLTMAQLNIVAKFKARGLHKAALNRKGRDVQDIRHERVSAPDDAAHTESSQGRPLEW